MCIDYRANALTADNYLAFQQSMGWPVDPRAQIEKSIANQLHAIAAYDGDRMVGMGRLIGDAAMYWYLNDVFILTAYQRKGIGTEIVRRLIRYATEASIPGTSVSMCLMCAQGKEPFYERLGFRSRPYAQEGAGMELIIDL